MFYLWSFRTPQVESKAPVSKKPTMVAQRDVDFGPYMAELQRRIKAKWFPPKADKTDRIQVVFRIHSNGVLSGLRLISASSSALANQAALKAVQNATPFRPLPEGSPDNVDIQFTFDYNVFKDRVGTLR